MLSTIINVLVSSVVLASYMDPGACAQYYEGKVLYEWLDVEYDWLSEEMKNQYEADGRYDRTHSFISGVKAFKGIIYLTVPRLRFTTGVPSTLNRIIQKEKSSVLTPFPDWAAQELGNCNALQCAMSMEVDPISGLMYVIDTGRSGVFGNNISGQPTPVICPPKLVVYDLADGSLVRSHNFPEDLVSNTTNFLNDIVIDRGGPGCKTARWIYITDAVDSKLVVFNLVTNKTHIIHHESMDYEPGDGSNITVNGVSYIFETPIDGLAISSDFEYVYYCALGSKKLYQVPSSVVRQEGADFASKVRLVGSKISQTGGMTYGTDNLFYGALIKNSVYKWEVTKDAQSKGGNVGLVELDTESEVVRDDERLRFPDSFTVDENQNLLFSACNAEKFLRGTIDFSGAQGPNFRIWSVNISESSYLAPRAGACPCSLG
uniref:Yellow protein n=1 Tax=Cepaea nemoralis TaxID=28835 RepID=A0A6B9QIV2_CEPNE|nr:yellow protein [Cepaea nemoralis]